MNFSLEPGTYVFAVSGGVDSVSLLHALHSKTLAAKDQPWKLIMAHYDHGIREDSGEDRQLVQALARHYGLPFVYAEGELGAGTSEAAAREVRYAFLRKVQQASGAQALITAHHQDDALETAIINVLRGSGRKGLTSLSSRPDLERPLLHMPKSDIMTYAKAHNLQWREDSTNQDQTYLRNYVRHRLLPRFDESTRDQLWQIITNMRLVNAELDTLLVKYLQNQSVTDTIDRQWFNHLPHTVSRELLAAWLRMHGVRNFDSKTLERLVVVAKTARLGSTFDVLNSINLEVHHDYLALSHPER